jgi:hypothetical protein
MKLKNMSKSTINYPVELIPGRKLYFLKEKTGTYQILCFAGGCT